jgi:hypothetical protein
VRSAASSKSVPKAALSRQSSAAAVPPGFMRGPHGLVPIPSSIHPAAATAPVSVMTLAPPAAGVSQSSSPPLQSQQQQQPQYGNHPSWPAAGPTPGGGGGGFSHPAPTVYGAGSTAAGGSNMSYGSSASVLPGGISNSGHPGGLHQHMHHWDSVSNPASSVSVSPRATHTHTGMYLYYIPCHIY